MTFDQLNSLPSDKARDAFMMCCTSSNWVDKMVLLRPFNDRQHLQKAAKDIWNEMSFDDYLEAFSGHPKIGDPASLKEKFKATKQLAENEQSAVQYASDKIINELATANQLYEDRFGYIFIVCATGKSAEQMLELVQQRLENDAQEEIEIAAAEQANITAIRIDKMIAADN